MEHWKDGKSVQESTHPLRPTWRGRSDRELVVAMRANISAAFEEFVARYTPLLLARSRRFELPQWEREDCVADTLESMMLRLVRPDVRAPKEMAAYLTRALHNRLVDITRQRAARVAEAECDTDWHHSGAVTALVSQHGSIASCEMAPGMTSTISPALERLSRALLDPLTDGERQLIGWESNMIPHRTIAAWLGLSHAAATKRIWRLRARLREIAVRHAESLGPAERLEVGRIINRRASGESIIHAEDGTGASREGRLRRRMTEEGETAP